MKQFIIGIILGLLFVCTILNLRLLQSQEKLHIANDKLYSLQRDKDNNWARSNVTNCL